MRFANRIFIIFYWQDRLINVVWSKYLLSYSNNPISELLYERLDFQRLLLDCLFICNIRIRLYVKLQKEVWLCYLWHIGWVHSLFLHSSYWFVHLILVYLSLLGKILNLLHYYRLVLISDTDFVEVNINCTNFSWFVFSFKQV